VKKRTRQNPSAMPADKLKGYRGKRDFQATPEPTGDAAAATGSVEPRFVVQEHHATRLHWDLRLEHDGVAVSFAVPNGIPFEPSENRLAVHTEDHPLEYLEFEGDIPAGEYGAGKMRIWDRGTYEAHKFDARKIEVSFHGERLHGRYGLFPLGPKDGQQGKDDWMIHRMDPPDPPREPMPERIVPMLAKLGGLPPDERGWCFEVKWDGVRAIAYAKPGRLRLESRNVREITDAYPEVRGILRNLGMREAVLDGEIVAFDDDGKPSFERLQRRMHVTAPSAVRKLAASTPVVYAIFDLLYLDGRSLMELPYTERRSALEGLQLNGPAWRVPAAHAGDGKRLLEATGAQGLEGIVAKRLQSRYEPGRRSGGWIKIKHTLRQELVIGGWMAGEGRRSETIGALLMGYFEDGQLVYAGRAGTGFTEKTLAEVQRSLAPIKRKTSPFKAGSKLPKGAQFVEPRLIAEIEFRAWTSEGIMRAPSFKGLRDDKPATAISAEGLGSGNTAEELFDAVEQLPDGQLRVTTDGRELKVTNWDKVLFPKTGFTKGDLIQYYARVAPTLLPHLKGRALTLKRYPNGVDSPYFYEKNSPSHRPEWIPTANIGGVNYTLVQERATLIWLGNLADIELHTSLSLAAKPEQPTILAFDLDPGAPAGLPECCEVALVLKGLFEQLGCISLAKTSGSKGLQVYVPLNTPVKYEQTKPFARRVAEALEQRLPKLVISRMTKELRKGKVLVDWSQNDEHKTTVTVYSVRARERPTVSTPVTWEEVIACRDQGDPDLLTFDTEDVLRRVDAQGDLFAPLLSAVQKLPALG
jgi:bifunctional non-homologous end joining protein LigD